MTGLPAGRELDALVAERVMGLHVEKVNRPVSWRVNQDGSRGDPIPHEVWELRDEYGEPVMVHGQMMHGYFPCPVPNYSTHIAAAWEVVEKLGGKFHLWFNPNWHNAAGESEPQWVVTYNISAKHEIIAAYEPCGVAKTAPLAICRAALKAVESLASRTTAVP